METKEKTVLNCVECVEDRITTSDVPKDMEFLGAVYAEGNPGIFEAFTSLGRLFANCPYNEAYVRQDELVNQPAFLVKPSDTNLDWVCLFTRNRMPGWCKSVFYEYLALFKCITNSSTVTSPVIKLFTKEQVDTWLEGTTMMDYMGDVLYSTLDVSIFKEPLEGFAASKFGWDIGTGPIPTFLRITEVKEDSFHLMPVTSLSSVALQSSFTLAKEDIGSLALMEKLSIYAAITNPLMKDAAQAYISMQNAIKEQTHG